MKCGGMNKLKRKADGVWCIRNYNWKSIEFFTRHFPVQQGRKWTLIFRKILKASRLELLPHQGY